METIKKHFFSDMGVMVTVIMVSMLRKIWRMERPSIMVISLK